MALWNNNSAANFRDYPDSPLFDTVVLTVFCWQYAFSQPTNTTFVSRSVGSTAGDWMLGTSTTVNNQLRFLMRLDNNVAQSCIDPGTFNTLQWYPVGGRFDGTDMTLWRETGKVATLTPGAGRSQPTGLAGLMATHVRDNGGGNQCDSAIAVPTVWNVALTDGEMQLLISGVWPGLIRPENIVVFDRLDLNSTNEILGPSVNHGTLVQVSDPPLLGRPLVTSRDAFRAPLVVDAPPLAWMSAYPDLVLDGRRTADRQHYAANISPIAAAALPPLTWGPVYPDGAVRAPARPVLEGGGPSVTQSAVPVPALSWKGVYADRIDQPRRPVGEGAAVSLPGLSAYPIPLLSWAGVQPARIDPPRQPVAEGFSVSEPQLSALPVPSLSWAGIFPDGAARAPGRPVLGGGIVGQPGISAYPIPNLSWLGAFTDGAARLPGRAALGFIADFLNTTANPLTPMSWGPRFVDQPGRGPQRPVAEGGSVGLVALAAFPVPPLAWLGSYPDGAARRAPRVAESFSAWVGGLANLAIPALSWGPRFVDPTWRPRLHQTQDYASPIFPPGAPPPAPAMSWSPAFPDYLFRILMREGPSQAAPVLPPPPPALSWAPRHPDVLLRAQGAREGARVDSLVQPFPPGLSFLPTYPGPVYPPKLREATWAIAPVAPVAADSPPLAWAPFFPDPVRVGRVANAHFAAPTLPPPILVTMWDPHYPNILRATPIHPMMVNTARLDLPPPLTPADRLGWLPVAPAFHWLPASPMLFAVGGCSVVFLVAPTGELYAILAEVGELYARLSE